MTDKVAWHDVENGAYSADLPLWRELAASAGGKPILEIGAGTGRVTLELARNGHRLIALERDRELADELRRRAAGLSVEVVVADACAFSLPRRVALCIVPMQTVQLLDDRPAFFACAASAIDPGGTLALALLPEELYTFEVELAADVLERGGLRYLSSPTALRKTPATVVLERRRWASGSRVLAPALDVVELARVTPDVLAREASGAGFSEPAMRSIAATDQHVGSDVLLLSRGDR